MQNFFKLLTGAQVLPIAERVVRSFGSEWEYDENGPCAELATALLRNVPGIVVPSNLTAFDLDLFKDLPLAKNMTLDLMRLVGGTQLGNVSVSLLQPGCKTTPHGHADSAYFGFYERYCVALQAFPGAQMVCGDETLQLTTGDAWWFDAKTSHCSINNSADDFIRLNIDVRIE